MVHLLLASGSPYRKALLQRVGLTFEVALPLVDEEKHKRQGEDPFCQAQRLSQIKALSLASQFPNHLIIGSDQIVSFENQIIGKPHNFNTAFERLKKMQGKTHQIATAVTLVYQNRAWTHLDLTEMHMRTLTDEEITNYLHYDEPYDCAGGYKFEKRGLSLFSKVKTEDPSAIEGLPVLWLLSEIKKL